MSETIPATSIDDNGSKSTWWEPLPSELRWLSTLNELRQGVTPKLQMAWRCREDGRIEWRTIPLHLEEFTP